MEPPLLEAPASEYSPNVPYCGRVTRRSYGQFCPAAKALDLVGERWTLLVVRELLLGPRRFTDLLSALPGLGTSLLAARLKQLEAAGVIRHEQLPPPAGSWVYQITDAGLGVALVVKALADWGTQLLDTPAPGETVRADWLALHLAVSTPPEAVAGPRQTYQIHVDGEVLHIVVSGAGAQAVSGPAPGPPDLILRTNQAEFIELCLGRTDLATLVTARRVQASGDNNTLARAARLFSTASRQATPKTGPAAAHQTQRT
jgi:DNA-binding HxlR family transcriptional regulator